MTKLTNMDSVICFRFRAKKIILEQKEGFTMDEIYALLLQECDGSVSAKYVKYILLDVMGECVENGAVNYYHGKYYNAAKQQETDLESGI